MFLYVLTHRDPAEILAQDQLVYQEIKYQNISE